jgi:photosystem II stability/assembly factor-like uncharacterized protein
LSGSDVRCLATDPHQPGVVYAGTQGQGILRSTDRGQSWQPLGLEGIIIKSLALSPTEPGLLYAGAKSPATIYASRDGGENWSELEGFREIRGRSLWFSPAEPPFSAYVQAISVSPEDPNHLVAGIEFGAVIRSEDGGQTWSNHLKGSLRDCHSLTFHTTNGEWVYEAGGSGAGASVSRDGGRTWQQSKSGLDRHYGWACAADPARPEVWYASISPSSGFPKFVPAAHIDGQARACIFRASGGGRWEKLAGGLPQPLDYMPYALITDPEAPGHLYAGLSSGDIWHTADYGDTWQQLPVNLGGIHRMMISL